MDSKVMFGVSNLHFGEYIVGTDGSVTLGTPYAIPGTVKITMDAETQETKVHADNVVYWSSYSDNGYSGEIENVLFNDTFKTRFMNYNQLADGGIAQIKGKQNKAVYFMFQVEGDDKARRGIFYNVSIGQISREYSTIEDSIEPATATLPFTVNGDNKTGVTRAAYTDGSAVYTTIFTNPPTPHTT